MRRSRGVDKNLRLRDHEIARVLRMSRTTFVGFAEVVAHERVGGSRCVMRAWRCQTAAIAIPLFVITGLDPVIHLLRRIHHED
jgi:hypothetical protein